MTDLPSTRRAALHALANLIDRGGPAPLPPSVYSALAREYADDYPVDDTTELEACLVGEVGLDVDQQLRAAALQAAAMWSTPEASTPDEVVYLASIWAEWLRDGVR